MTLQHPYIPATDAEEQEMLSAMGVASFEELIAIIPEQLRLRDGLGLADGVSELEVAAELSRLAGLNRPAGAGVSFMGGGVYDHYIPEAIKAIAMRSEFYTAYTPYQAEVSQGTLQAMYEFQTMIAEISGMDVSNASLYDGASAAAEAVSMAFAITGKRRILMADTVYPATQQVVATYLLGRDAELVTVGSRNGRIDAGDLAAKAPDAAALLLQSPNLLGLVEDWRAARQALPEDALLIASADPMTLGLLEAPGQAGADIYVGEGQSLGIPVSFGGPYLGLMATGARHVRKMPGRIIGRTKDVDGQDGYTMVLRTREQDIRREKATSNICTNQGLLALWSTIYLALIGKQGLSQLARLAFDKSQYLGRAIEQLDGYSLPFGFGYVKELVVKSPGDPHALAAAAAAATATATATANLFLGVIEWQGESYLQLAVTEKRTRADLDRLVDFLKSAS